MSRYGRCVVVDTETTGFGASEERLVEIGCVELIDLMPTGRELHTYINPMKDVNPGAFGVHGLNRSFLRDFPTFSKVARKFVNFLGKDAIVAHNATFDMSFIQAELGRAHMMRLGNEVIDTLDMSRKVKMGGKASLDAMLSHFKIDKGDRAKHGALKDAQLLAKVYLQLMGGKQIGLDLVGGGEPVVEYHQIDQTDAPRIACMGITRAEHEAHVAFVSEMKEPIWFNYPCMMDDDGFSDDVVAVDLKEAA